jgi:ATP-dependent Clp protease ATP-binding subunit ClpC
VFEQFTERARQVVILAQEEARTLRHDHVGPEHILLGLLREREGVAARVLAGFDITLERARGEVVRIIGVGDAASPAQLTFAPDAKRVLEESLHVATSLGHNYIGTEHLMLALLTFDAGVPTRILLDCGAQPDQVGHAVIRMLPGPPPPPQRAVANGPPPNDNGFQEWIVRVGPGAGLRRLLMFAAARALDEGRDDIQPRDVLLALTRDEHTGPLLADLGVDDVAILRALERRRPPEAPRSSNGG